MELNNQKIKQLRMDKGWTQQELAQISALSVRTVQRVEKEGLGSIETSKALASAFNLTTADLQYSMNIPTNSASAPSRANVWYMLASFMLGVLAATGVINLFGY